MIMIKLNSTELMVTTLKSKINLFLPVIRFNPKAIKVDLITASSALIKLQIAGRLNKIISSETHLWPHKSVFL
jgi:hypothetical protein